MKSHEMPLDYIPINTVSMDINGGFPKNMGTPINIIHFERWEFPFFNHPASWG